MQWIEYGILGGRAGSHILALLRELRMPIVTTLHTILRDPDPRQDSGADYDLALVMARMARSGFSALPAFHRFYVAHRDCTLRWLLHPLP